MTKEARRASRDSAAVKAKIAKTPTTGRYRSGAGAAKPQPRKPTDKGLSQTTETDRSLVRTTIVTAAEKGSKHGETWILDGAKTPHLALVVKYLMAKVDESAGDVSAREAARAIAVIDDALPRSSGSPESDLAPFYSSAALTRRWGMSRQAVHQRVARGQLLALPVNDGSVAFPAFQFRNRLAPRPDEVLEGIPEVIEILGAAGRAPLGIAAWLTAPDARLGGLSAVDWLLRRRAVEMVVAAARADVVQWAQ